MPNAVVQWQIIATDPEATTAFFSGLFDWRVQRDNALGYRQLRTGAERGIDGGVWPSPASGPNVAQLFVAVEDIDATIAKAVAMGANVLVPKAVLPDGDAMAVLTDPSGMAFGLCTLRG